MNKGIRVVFMGTPDFAVASLKAILNANIEVAAIVTAQDKPSGRGMQMRESAVKIAAKEHNIKPVLQPEKLKDPQFLKALGELNADLFVVVAFRMLPEAVWQMPRLGTINLHASILPHYRGAAPINWAIINGEKESGVTTFFIEKEIDTGKILLQEKVTIGEEETAGELHDKLMMVGASLLVKTIKLIETGNIKALPQNLNYANTSLKLAPKIFKEHCKINWSDEGQKIADLIRGLCPYPAAYSDFLTEDNKLLQIKIFQVKFEIQKHNLQTGIVEYPNQKQMRVACSNGFIYILSLQMAGKKQMDIESFLRGFPGKDRKIKAF